MIHLPSEIRENIAVINGTPWGFGRFRTFSYDGLSTEEKLYRISQAYSFFKHAIKPGYTGCLWLVKREREWNQAFAKIKNRCPEENTEHISELQEAWLKLLRRSKTVALKKIQSIFLSFKKLGFKRLSAKGHKRNTSLYLPWSFHPKASFVKKSLRFYRYLAIPFKTGSQALPEFL